MKTGFDNDKYIKLQSEHIHKRINQFGGKLYMEFGGKLFDDYHASRVLPGFLPDSKLKMLKNLSSEAEIIIVINASDIEKNKTRGDLGITYDSDVLRLIDLLREQGFYIGSVVISQYSGQINAEAFKKRLENLNIKVYLHYRIKGYPMDIPLIVSDEGYGKNEYIKTSRPLVIVTAPGPGSGKMATCLSQLYHEHKHGGKAGYAKFETFPVWNLSLSHPVNVAYEAATSDLDDVNMIDPFHLSAYNTTAVNYNRDVEVFPVLNAIFEKISGQSPYKSPTDMGVNMTGNCIIDDETVKTAARQEIVRRYYAALCKKRDGIDNRHEVFKLELLMKKVEITVDDRTGAREARQKAAFTGAPAAALDANGTVVTGKTSSLLTASSAAILNALKTIANIDEDLYLIPATIIEPICDLKINYLKGKSALLNVDETLVALSISATFDDNAKNALNMLPKLYGREFHSTVILPAIEDVALKKLGLNVTYEPVYETNSIYRE